MHGCGVATFSDVADEVADSALSSASLMSRSLPGAVLTTTLGFAPLCLSAAKPDFPAFALVFDRFNCVHSMQAMFIGLPDFLLLLWERFLYCC